MAVRQHGFWYSLGIMLVALVAALYLTQLTLAYLAPFVLALALAAFIEPVVTWLSRRGVPRGWAVGAALFFTVAILGLIVGAAVSRLVVEIGQLVGALPGYSQDLANRVESLLQAYGRYSASLPQPLEESIRSQMGSLVAVLQSLAGAVLAAVSGLPGFLLVLVVTVVATFFLSRDKEAINAFLLSLFPESLRGRVTSVRREVIGSALGFAGAYVTLMIMTAILSVLGLTFIGARYALVVGLVVGLLDILPGVGPATIFVPWIAYSVFFGSIPFAIKLAVVLAILSVVRQMVEPRVVGHRTGLHPLATLLAMYLGIRLFGASGFLIGPIAAIILKAVGRAGLLPGFGGDGGHGDDKGNGRERPR